MSFAFVFPGQGSQSVGMMAAYGDSGTVVQPLTKRPPRSATTCGPWSPMARQKS
jgi:malonyl CoA-acyl carrier protein transacylase